VTGFVGADVDQLDRLAQAFERQAAAYRQIAASSSLALMVATWTGADIDRVRSEWNRGSKPTVLGVAGELTRLAIDLRRQAHQQRETSGTLRPVGFTDHPILGEPLTHSTRDLIQHYSDADGELLTIREVVGDDGQHRFVVMINGTLGTLSEWQKYLQLHGWLENLPASFNVDTPSELIISEIIRQRLGDNKDAEVMIVGYSQGGMTAQSIADSGRFNVKEVMTIGSPEIPAFNGYGGANVTRLYHNADEVEAITEAARLQVLGPVADAAMHLLSADTPLNAEISTFRDGTPGLGAHDVDKPDYMWLGERYDASIDPEIVVARERQAVFLEARTVEGSR
jgi:hypothetical protein